MALGSRYTVLTQVMDDGRLIRSTDPDPTVVLTPEQASALIALGAISPIPTATDQVNEAVNANDISAIVRDVTGNILSYVQGGVPHTITRNAAGGVVAITGGGRTSTVIYDATGLVAGVITT